MILFWLMNLLPPQETTSRNFLESKATYNSCEDIFSPELHPSSPKNIYDHLDDMMVSKMTNFSELGYFPQQYTSSLQATYFALYILEKIEKIDSIDKDIVVDYILGNYNDSSQFFVDCYALRYLDMDPYYDPYPYSSLLEVNCYAILSLELLDRLDLVDNAQMISFIRSCYNPSSSGFIGQPYSLNLHPNFRISTMDNTYYAVLALAILGDDWSLYPTEKQELIDYILGLQSTNTYVRHFGGFYNDADMDLDSIPFFDPNLQSAYYCLCTLTHFNVENHIRDSDFHQYLNGLYDDVEKSFDFAYFNVPAGYMDIVATSFGLYVGNITGYSAMDEIGVRDFILNNKNNWAMWNNSRSYPFQELIDSFQVIRNLQESLGYLPISNADKDKIVSSLEFYRSEDHGFALLPCTYTTVELLNTLVESFSLLDKLSLLDEAYFYGLIKDCYHLTPGMTEEYNFLCCKEIFQSTQVGSILFFRSFPIEFYTRSQKAFFNEIDLSTSHIITFFALNALDKLNKLDNFHLEKDLSLLFDDIINAQFLESGFSNYGGFLPGSSYKGLSSKFQNKSIYFTYTYYAVKALEILSKNLGYGDITDYILDLDALNTYIHNHKYEDATQIYCVLNFTDNLEEILENTYYMIYILGALNLNNLDKQKVKNFVVLNLNYSNIKNVYYSYKIFKMLDIDLTFDINSIYLLINNIYSENSKEFFLSTNKQKISQEVFGWVSELYINVLANSPITINIEHLESFKFLSNGNFINFSINSSLSGTYEFWIDGSFIHSNSFSCWDEFFDYSLDNFTDQIGDHSIKINATNLDSKYCEITASFTVYSDSQTTITIHSIENYMLGSNGHKINFSIDSEYPDKYKLMIDNSLIASGGYSSGNSIIQSIDGYDAGKHILTISANSTDGKESNATVEFWVFIESFIHISILRLDNYEFKSIGNEISFKINASFPDSFKLYIDDALKTEGLYSFGGDISNISIDGYYVGEYNITIWANGTDGKESICESSFSVYSLSNTIVNIEELEDYEFLTIGNYIKFNISSLYPDFYRVYVNNEVVNTSLFESEQYYYVSIDGYGIGTHTVMIWAVGEDGKEGTASEKFCVYSNSTTVINVNDIPSYSFLSMGNAINFSISSMYVGIYNISIDGVIVKEGSYVPDEIIICASDGYSIGNHMVQINAECIDGKKATYQTIFNVFSTSITIITIIKLDNCEFMSSGNFLNFSLSTDYPDYYEIWIDNKFVKQGDYLDDVMIWISLDNFSSSMGNHSVLIKAFSLDGKEATYQSEFEVFSSSITLIEQISFSDYEFLTLNHNITFKISSLYPDTFKILIDRILLLNASFYNGQAFSIPIDGYLVGLHHIYIEARGLDELTDVYNGIFEVYSLSNTMINLIHLEDYVDGSKGNRIIFNITGKYSGSYDFWIDGVLINSNVFYDGQEFNISLDGYCYGKHNVTIRAVGLDNDEALLTVFFEVYSLYDQASITSDTRSTKELKNTQILVVGIIVALMLIFVPCFLPKIFKNSYCKKEAKE